METAAGVDGEDAVEGAEPPASQAIRRRRTPHRPTRRHPSPQKKHHLSSPRHTTSLMALPTHTTRRPTGSTRTCAVTDPATGDDATRAAAGSAATADAPISAPNVVPANSHPPETPTAPTVGKAAAPAPSPTHIPTRSPVQQPNRSFCPASRSPSTARVAKNNLQPRPARQTRRPLRSRSLHPPISIPLQPAGTVAQPSQARRFRGGARPTRGQKRAGHSAILAGNRGAMDLPTEMTEMRAPKLAATTAPNFATKLRLRIRPHPLSRASLSSRLRRPAQKSCPYAPSPAPRKLRRLRMLPRPKLSQQPPLTRPSQPLIAMWNMSRP